ncbi:MAG: hypothetical protein Q7T46_02655 [Polaromonas sp.]|nr:hypothetical protein [Polaromonas sp.]
MKKMKISDLDQDEARFLSRVMTMGAGTSLPVVMQPSEFARLVGVIYRDNGKGPELEAEHPGLWMQIDPGRDYYEIPESWFMEPLRLGPSEHAALLMTGIKQIKAMLNKSPRSD